MDDVHLKANEKSKYLAKLKKLLAAKERKLERCLRAERSKAHVRRKIKEHSLIAAKEREGKHTPNDSNTISLENKTRSRNEDQSNFCAKKVVVSVVSESSNIGTKGIKERKDVVKSNKLSKGQSQNLFENENNSASTISSNVDKNLRFDVNKGPKSANITVNNLVVDKIKKKHLKSSSNISLCKNNGSNIVPDNLKEIIQCDSIQDCDKDTYVSKVSSDNITKNTDSSIKDCSLDQENVFDNFFKENSVLLDNNVSCKGYADGYTNFYPQSPNNLVQNLTKSSLSKTYFQHSEIISTGECEKRNQCLKNSDERTSASRKLKSKWKQNQFSDSSQPLGKVIAKEKSPLLSNSDRSELVSDNLTDLSDNVQKNKKNLISSSRKNTLKELKVDKSFCQKDTQHRITNDFSKDEQIDKGFVNQDSLSLCQDVGNTENAEEKLQNSESICSEHTSRKTTKGSSSIRKAGSKENLTQSTPLTPILTNSIPTELNTNSEKSTKINSGTVFVGTRKDSVIESPVSNPHTPFVINSVNEKTNTTSSDAAVLTCSADMKHRILLKGKDSKLRRSRPSTPKSSSSSHSSLKIKFSDCHRNNETYCSSFHKASSSSKDILDSDSALWESQISKSHMPKKGGKEDLLNQFESTSKCFLSTSDEDQILESEKTIKEFSHMITERPPNLLLNNISHYSETNSESCPFEPNQASKTDNSKTPSQNADDGVLRNPGLEEECESNTAPGNNPDPGITDKDVTTEQNPLLALQENGLDYLKTSQPPVDQGHISVCKTSHLENTVENLMHIDSSKSSLQCKNLGKGTLNYVMKTDQNGEMSTFVESRHREETDIPKQKDGQANNSSQIHEDITKEDVALICVEKEDDAHLKTLKASKEIFEETEGGKRPDNDDENCSKESTRMTSSVKRKTCFKKIKKVNTKKEKKEILQDSEVNISDKETSHDTEVIILETLNKDTLPDSSLNNSKLSDKDRDKFVTENIAGVVNEHNANDFKSVKEKKRNFQYPCISGGLKYSPKGTPIMDSVSQKIFMKPKMSEKQTAFETVQEQPVAAVVNPKIDVKAAAVIPKNLVVLKAEPVIDILSSAKNLKKIVDQESRVNNYNSDCTTRHRNSPDVTDVTKESKSDLYLMKHAAEMNSESNKTSRNILTGAQNLKDTIQNEAKEISQSCMFNRPEASNLHVYDRKPVLSDIPEPVIPQEADAVFVSSKNGLSGTFNPEESLRSDNSSTVSAPKTNRKSVLQNHPVIDVLSQNFHGIDEIEAKSIEYVQSKTGEVSSEALETPNVDTVIDEILFDPGNFDDVEVSQHKKASLKVSPLKSSVNQKAVSSHPVIDAILFAPENFEDINIIEPMNQNHSDSFVKKHSDAGVLEESLKSTDTSIQFKKIITPKFVSFCPASKISSEQSEKYNDKNSIISNTDSLSLENELEEILNKRSKKPEGKLAIQRGTKFHVPKLGTSLEDNLEAILSKGKLPKSSPNFMSASITNPSSLTFEDQFEEILKKKKADTDSNISFKQHLSTFKCKTSLEDELEAMLMKTKECSVSRTTSFGGMPFQSAKQEMKRPTFDDKISSDKFESVLMKRKGILDMKVAPVVDVSFQSAKQELSKAKGHTKMNGEYKSIPQNNAKKCLSKLDNILNKTSSIVNTTHQIQRPKMGSSNLEDEFEAIIKKAGKKPIQSNLIQKSGFCSAKAEVTSLKPSTIEDELEEMLKKRSNEASNALLENGFQTPKCQTRNTSFSKTIQKTPDSLSSSKVDLKSFMSRPRRSNSFIPVTPKIGLMLPTPHDKNQSQNSLTAKIATPSSLIDVQTPGSSTPITPKHKMNYQSPELGKIQMLSRRKRGSPYIPVVPKNRTPLTTKEPDSEISTSNTTFKINTVASKNEKKSSTTSKGVNCKDEKNSSPERDFDPMHNSEMMFVLSDANDFFEEDQSNPSKKVLDDQDGKKDLKEKIINEKNFDEQPGHNPIYMNSSNFSENQEKISSVEAKRCLPSFNQNLDQINETDEIGKNSTKIDNCYTGYDLSVFKDDTSLITPITTPKSTSSKEMMKNAKRRSIYEAFYDGLHNLEKSKDKCKQVIGFKVLKTEAQTNETQDLKSSEQPPSLPTGNKTNISERTSIAPKPLMSGPRKDFKPLTPSPPLKLEPNYQERGKAALLSPFVNNQKRRQPLMKVPLISHEDENESISTCQKLENESSKSFVPIRRRKFNMRKRSLENQNENCSGLSEESVKKRSRIEEDAVLITDSQMEKIFCTSFDVSVNQEEDSTLEDGVHSKTYSDHKEHHVKSEKSFDEKEQSIATTIFSSEHTDIRNDVDTLKVNHINPNKLTECGASKVDSREIIGEEKMSTDQQLNIKQEKNVECTEYSKYTELDVLDYSQFEFSEDFLSTENSDTKNSRKRKRGHIGNAIQRRSPRISTTTNSSSWSQSVELTSSQRTRRKKYVSKAETCLIISSVFQYLVDEANRNKKESDFCLPMDIFKEIISVKLSSQNDELNTKTELAHDADLERSMQHERILDLVGEKINQKYPPEHLSEKQMHIKDEPKIFRVSPTLFLGSQAVHKPPEVGDDSLSEPMCYHRNDALDSQQLEISVVAETDLDKTKASSKSNSGKTLEQKCEISKENGGDEISKCKKNAKVNLMLDKLPKQLPYEEKGNYDLDAKVFSHRVQQETFIETDHEVSLELFEDGLPEEENIDSSLLDLKNTCNQDHVLTTLSFEKVDFLGEKDGSYLLPSVDTPKEKLSRKMSDRSIKGLCKFIGTMVGSLGTQKSSAQTIVECPNEEMTDFTSSPLAVDVDKHGISPATEQYYLNTQIKDLLTKPFETEAVGSKKHSQCHNKDSNDKKMSMKKSIVEENLEPLLNSNVDTLKESNHFRSDLSDRCKKDLDILFGVEEEKNTDMDEEESETYLLEEKGKFHGCATPKFSCSTKTKMAISCPTSTPKIPKISKAERDPFTTPKDSNIRRVFNLSPLLFTSQTTPNEKGLRPQIKGRLFDDSGLSLDMSSRPCDVDDDDEDGVLPIECLKLTREENVVYVNGGQYMFNGSEHDYIVCILPTTISVWTKGNGEEWENELEWFLSPHYQATYGWSLKKENHVIMLTMEENKEGNQKLSLFFYDLTSGESNMAAIDIKHENDRPVTNVLCCALDVAVIICSNHPATFSVSKYTLTDDSKHLTLFSHLEGSAGHLIDVQDICHLDKFVMGLTGEGEAVLWNHETGRISKRIDLCTRVLRDVSLAAVRNVKDGLLFHLIYRIKETTPGFSLLVNSETETSVIQHDYQSLQHSWKGLKSMKAMEDTLIAVDFCGNMGLWEIDSGKLLAALVKSDVTCVGFSGSKNKLIYFGLKTGIVHVYSLQQ